MKTKISARLISSLLCLCMALSLFSGTLVLAKGDTPDAAVLPEGHTLIFADDFEGYSDKITVPSVTGWSSAAQSQTALIELVRENGNNAARLSNKAEKTGYPRLARLIGFDVSSLTIQYSVSIGSGTSYIEYFADGKVKKTLVSLSETTDKVKKGYNSVLIEMDFKSGEYSVKLNGRKYLSDSFALPEDILSGQIRFNNAINPNSYIIYDNVLMSTPDDINAGQVIHTDGTIDFSALKGNADAPMVPELRQHPRVLINDFEPIKQKIAQDRTAAAWYEKVKAEGDKLLSMPVYEYSQNSRGNILETARGIYSRAYVLAFLYNTENDTRYLDRAYNELEAAAKFPDWSPDSFLCTAELMQSYAIAYDWLYYGLSETQKEVLTDAVMRLGVTPLIFNYEGQPTGGTNFVLTSMNWNPVCNSSAILTALGMIADSNPSAAEYILEKAAASIPTALAPYAPEGATPEGTGYWAYGTDYLVYSMAALETAFKDGYTLPEAYRFDTYPGISSTADFPVYYSGPAGSFNFGDSGTAKISTPSLYWFSEKYGKPQYTIYQKGVEEEVPLSAKDSVLALIWYNPGSASASADSFSLDKAYSNSEKEHNGVALRSSFENPNALYAAMQGGYNRANHQYLSLGSFVIDADGERWFTMRGYGSYDYPDYFAGATNTSTRWTYYVTRGEGQNTIIANPGIEADQDANALAQIVKFESCDAEGFGILDMTQTNKAFTDAKRGIYMRDNRSSVLVQDEIKAESESDFYWFAHTDADVSIADDGRSAMLSIGEKRLYVSMEKAPADARFVLMDAKPLETSPNPEIQTLNFGQKLAIHMTNIKTLELAVSFTPLAVGEGAPTATHSFVPMSQWTVRDAKAKTAVQAEDATILMLGSPNALSRGSKTYVDPENLDVMPIEKDGRTLVPVRFIAESLGAQVDWDEATSTVSVNEGATEIKLVIDQNEMSVNGSTTLLDVPAETINDRTMLPLRALAEALGRRVFWDERGLIVIKDSENEYSKELTSSLVSLLASRVKADGVDLCFFDPDKDTYYVSVDENAEAAPTLTFESAIGEQAQLSQSEGALSPAYMTLAGKRYVFNFVKNIYSDKVMNNEIRIAFDEDGELPDENPWLDVKNIEISGGFNYGTAGLTDNSLETSWRAEGEQWVSFDLGEEQELYGFALATMSGDKRSAKFDLLTSNDGESWTTLIKDGRTNGKTLLPEQFELNTRARYVKILGHGNTTNLWNSYTEVRFYKDAAQASTDKASWSHYFNDGTAILSAGETKRLTVCGIANDGADIPMSADTQYTFTSANEAIAKVDKDGNVTGISSGEVRITVCSFSSKVHRTSYVKLIVE